MKSNNLSCAWIGMEDTLICFCWVLAPSAGYSFTTSRYQQAVLPYSDLSDSYVKKNSLTLKVRRLVAASSLWRTFTAITKANALIYAW